MDLDKSLSTIGVSRSELSDMGEYEELEHLTQNFIHSIQWSTVPVAGDPYTGETGDQIDLQEESLYNQLVEEGKGGGCYSLNSFFADILEERGYDVSHSAGYMLGDDGEVPDEPNHLTNIVSLEEDYLVDVGLGKDSMRKPVKLNGEVNNNSAGLSWRVVENSLSEHEYVAQYQTEEDSNWQNRYAFNSDEWNPPQNPESSFSDQPVIVYHHETGYEKLDEKQLEQTAPEERQRFRY